MGIFRFLFIYFAFIQCLSLSGQNVLINEEWIKVDKGSKIFFNGISRQLAIASSKNGYVQLRYNDPGKWIKPTESTRISLENFKDVILLGISSDSLIFMRDSLDSSKRLLSYNLSTTVSRILLKTSPQSFLTADNCGVIFKEANQFNWRSLIYDTLLTSSMEAPSEMIWQGFSGGKWLFIGESRKISEPGALNFYDGAIAPFPYPINRGKPIIQAHWINADSLFVVEEENNALSIRLYALVDKMLTKGNPTRLKVGSYSMQYEIWEDTIPSIVLDPVNVIGKKSEGVIPSENADKQLRKLGRGKFAVRFKFFTDQDQAYGFLSRLINILPGAYASNIDSGIVILGPRRVTRDEVKRDSVLVANVAPNLELNGIIGFADQLKERNETVISLHVMDRLNMASIPFQISFFNRTQDEMIFVDSVHTGQVSLVYAHGEELGITITSKGYVPRSIRINSKTDSLSTIYHQDVLLDRMAPFFRGVDGESVLAIENRSINFQNILFSFDSSQLNEVSKPELRAMADLIKRSGATQVQVIGHTDNVGSSVYNQKLGLRRALSVGDELIRMGVSQKILKPISRGESYPTVPNNTEFNRSLNRRVVLELK